MIRQHFFMAFFFVFGSKGIYPAIARLVDFRCLLKPFLKLVVVFFDCFCKLDFIYQQFFFPIWLSRSHFIFASLQCYDCLVSQAT